MARLSTCGMRKVEGWIGKFLSSNIRRSSLSDIRVILHKGDFQHTHLEDLGAWRFGEQRIATSGVGIKGQAHLSSLDDERSVYRNRLTKAVGSICKYEHQYPKRSPSLSPDIIAALQSRLTAWRLSNAA